MRWKLWKRAERPGQDYPMAAPAHPTLDEQADKLANEAMEGIGRSLRRAAEIRQTLADGALELRINRK